MSHLHGDRRRGRREAHAAPRRRYPRLFLDVDWFIESLGCSTLGRGLEISPRGALLPLQFKGPFSSEVTLHVCLPARPKMFRARGHATSRPDRGWAIQFSDVTTEDLNLLAATLIEEYGLQALPALEKKYSRFMDLAGRLLRDSI
ncbi:MAG: hypothetical protein K1X64_04645 [Myxococcaceae bacterium]|nr:hypothetical protein [Myxococcaceae bacterium]